MMKFFLPYLNQWKKLSVIALIIIVLLIGFAKLAGWISAGQHTPQYIIDVFNANNNQHNNQDRLGYRKAHLDGICLIGHFESNGQAAVLSTADIFKAGQTPVIGRLSSSNGYPYAASATLPVRGMALQFQGHTGQEWRLAMNSFPVLRFGTVQAFFEDLEASRIDPETGKQNPAKLQAFAESYPDSAAFRQWLTTHILSDSFANTAYYGVHAFRFIDASGKTHFVRWSMQPETPFMAIDRQGDYAADYLYDDIMKRARKDNLRWQMIITIADDGDPVNDGTQQWPTTRRKINAGTLIITQVQTQRDGVCRDINFDPTILPIGIKTSDDPILAIRSAAYSESFRRRAREGVPPALKSNKGVDE